MGVKRLGSSSSTEVELKDTTTLMRYMPFPRFLALLNGKVSFTALHVLGSINDPLECRQITEPEVILTKLLDLPDRGAMALEELKKATPEMIRTLWDSPSYSPQNRTYQLAETFHRYISERRAVSCWFSNEFESAAMWAAFSPHGIAIRTTIQKLESVLPKEKEFLLASIRYRNRDDFTINAGNFTKFPHMALRPFLLKGLEFAHEKEVRLITRCNPYDRWPVITAPNFVRCVHEIIVSPYLDLSSAQELKTLIESLLKSNGLNDTSVVTFSKINSIIHRDSALSADLDGFLDALHPPDDPLPL